MKRGLTVITRQSSDKFCMFFFQEKLQNLRIKTFENHASSRLGSHQIQVLYIKGKTRFSGLSKSPGAAISPRRCHQTDNTNQVKQTIFGLKESEQKGQELVFV